MKITILTFLLLGLLTEAFSQSDEFQNYRIGVETYPLIKNFFANDPVWRGADCASSIDLGNGKVLWLFGDSFINQKSASRVGSKMIRNSIALQQGYDLKEATLKYWWNQSGKEPESFFQTNDSTWYWPGHGSRIGNQVVIFLMKIKSVPVGLGFEAVGWDVALIDNPDDEPAIWKIRYIKGIETYGLMAGSGAVLTDQHFLYAYGAVEPSTHQIYLLRWKLDELLAGDISQPEWYINNGWQPREQKDPVPKPLFIGETEFSVHFDSQLKKYILVQSIGFGKAQVAIRISDRPEGPWSNPNTVFTPDYTGIEHPMMYSAKAHPELTGNGLIVTYNINSMDFKELLRNEKIYFPQLLQIKIEAQKNN